MIFNYVTIFNIVRCIMSLVSVKEYLKKYNIDDRIMEFDVSSATVSEAAIALSCREEEIAKTMGFMVNDKAIVIVVAGNKKIDNSKYKKEYYTKAKMVPFDDVENVLGHEVGGVCPFGLNDDVSVYLDVSLKKYDYVYPACGSHNSAIKLSLEELENASNYVKWVDVCKD